MEWIGVVHVVSLVVFMLLVLWRMDRCEKAVKATAEVVSELIETVGEADGYAKRANAMALSSARHEAASARRIADLERRLTILENLGCSK